MVYWSEAKPRWNFEEISEKAKYPLIIIKMQAFFKTPVFSVFGSGYAGSGIPHPIFGGREQHATPGP